MILTGDKGRTATGIVNSISADQIAAEAVGKDTRFSSLQLSVQRGTGYGGTMKTLSWSRSGIPLTAENDPHLLFRKLFSVETARDRLRRDVDFRRRGSVLDLVMAKAKRMESRVSSHDKAKLDEYLTSVRETESQLQRNIAWSEKPRPGVKLENLGDYTKPRNPQVPGFDYPTYAKLMFDLMALAFQTDSTRVISYMVRTESGDIFDCHGTTNSFHGLSHHSNDPNKLNQLAHVDVVNMGFLAQFIGRLQSIQEPDGNTLLDRTMVATASGMGIDHSRDRLPVILVGGGALGLKHSTHVQLRDNTPLSNVWRTMVDRMGVQTDGKFLDSTGLVREVLA